MLKCPRDVLAETSLAEMSVPNKPKPRGHSIPRLTRVGVTKMYILFSQRIENIPVDVGT